MLKSNHIKNWQRYTLQWGVLALLIFFLTGLARLISAKAGNPDPEALCPLGGIEALATYIQRGSLPCSMSTLQIVMGIGLVAAVVLFSRLFCGYLCPVGTVEDLLIKLRRKLKIREVIVKSGSIADKILRVIKYGILFWIVFMTVSDSELFCKNLDPYYAVATGFKGEITLWMSLVTVSAVIFCGLFINMFWCRYICPLGAISGTFKFWAWLLGFGLVWWGVSLVAPEFPWWIILASFCVLGYLLEILNGKPKLQVLSVVKSDDACTSCGLCKAACPYHIDIPAIQNGRVTDIDCTLCGECIASCHRQALNIGVRRKNSNAFMKYLPAIITLVIAVAAYFIGNSYEIPTIDVTWNLELMDNEGNIISRKDPSKLETLRLEGLQSVKCYGSSMAFKAKAEGIRGVYGVKTYVKKHNVDILYDPNMVTAEKIQEEVYVPAKFRITAPDPEVYDSLKVVTIRTEKMYDNTDIYMLGLQFGLSGKKIYGLESEFACPLIVHVMMAPDETVTEDEFRELVDKKVLRMPLHGGTKFKETPVDYEFVRLEKGESRKNTIEFLEEMFEEFEAPCFGLYKDSEGKEIIEKRADHYKNDQQYVYEMVNTEYDKPVVKIMMPFLSNHLSREEGIISVGLHLNCDYKPAIMIRFAAPVTADRIWELITKDTWTITYSEEDVREEPARLRFEVPGEVYPVDMDLTGQN
ncbi:MAG: 4Fe-4S binding protein [Bacteroidales bacterium]|nr:4Fe-4S binding protein [Candidatus Cryptobacteroides onthequi]